MNAQPAVLRGLLPAICLAAGAVCAVAVWGRSSEDTAMLKQRLAEFQNLAEDQQQTIRRNNSDFLNQPESRRKEIQKIYDESRANPEMKEAMERYFTWWSSLKQDDWDRFREMNSEERIAFVRSHWTSISHPNQEIEIVFRGPPSTRLPTLRLTFDEYWKIISTTLSQAEKPESLQKELEACSSDKNRALRLTLWIFETLPNVRDTQEMENRGKIFITSLLQNCQDEAWKQKVSETLRELEGKRFAEMWIRLMIFTILDQATITLGDELRKEYPVTQQQIIDAFASLQDKELQQSLMTMRPEDARKRLELLAQTNDDPTPEQQLLAKYDQFARERERILRSPLGFGGPGPTSVPAGPRDGRSDSP